jgi:hypothetical protein
MTTFSFTIILADHDVLTDAMAEAIYAAGADDASCRSGDAVCAVDFDREAESLEAAIRAAVAEVTAAGFKVQRIELEPETLSQPA